MKKKFKIINILMFICLILNIIPAQADTYHKHVDGTGTINSNTIYATTNPGGCYKGAGHSHNKTGTCSKGTVNVPNGVCECTIGIDDYTYQNPDCCGHYHQDGIKCGKQLYTQGTGYTCGSPVNTWKPKCGITQEWGYTVNHYKNNILTDTITGASTTQLYTAPLKNYTNYEAPSIQTVTLANDDTTEINYYYTATQYTIDTTIDSGYGALSEDQRVDHNNSSIVYFCPASGYDLEYIKVNGVAQKIIINEQEVNIREPYYIFKNVTNNQTVNVKFKITETKKSQIINITYNWIDLGFN